MGSEMCIRDRLKQMNDEGHAIQLHLHPHWLDSSYDGVEWKMDTRRYRLHQWADSEIASVVKQSVEWIFTKIGVRADVFRAGGWCIQPFEKLRDSLAACGILTDSTIYRNGYLSTSTHFFDFRKAPQKDQWRFDADPCIEDEEGRFLEIPITAKWIGPWSFWSIAVKRLAYKERAFGDGRAVGGGKYRKLKLLTFGDIMPLSLDSERHQWIEQQIASFLKKKISCICVISHPKAISKEALQTLEMVIEKNGAKIQFTSIS